METDVVIVGGGPGGLAAALALGRARKRVLVCDDGPRRNQTAAHLHNFVTRDGATPDEFRRVARDQLAVYDTVEVRDERIESIEGARGTFRLGLGSGAARARRVLLCTGMRDEMLAIDGFAALWGRSIFQCPYCHGWEVRDQAWGFLATADNASHVVPFALMALGWSRDLVVFTGGAFELDVEAADRLAEAGIRVETAPIAQLASADGRLRAVELEGGDAIARDVIFAHPPQRQVELVAALGVDLDEGGYVATDERGETSIAGVFAAGDLTTQMQGAILAAAAATRAAAMINLDLSLDLDSELSLERGA